MWQKGDNMINNEFKVWCINKQEWEKNICFMNEKGQLLHETRTGLIPLRSDTHKAVFYIERRDKNGVKIHEGDIVKDILNIGDGLERFYLIEYSDERAGFVMKKLNKVKFDGNSVGAKINICNLTFRGCEKCGTKFENPELLEYEGEE